MTKKLFPEYLNQGSSGGAVYMLEIILIAMGFAPGTFPTGRYTDSTAEAVKRLQESLGFTGTDIDGNFGPATRKALREKTGLHVNDIPIEALTAETLAVIPLETD